MKARFASVAAVIAGLFLAGCNGTFEDLTPKAEKALPEKIVAQMKAKGMTRTSPIMVRIFKEEGVLEVWKQKDTGRYDQIAGYEICKWSGKLGPKFTEGDRQAPEGFYTVRPGQMNPKSSYHLSFNIGFPNAYDRAHGRSGQHLMVHGACSSAGCYSMSDEYVEQIYAFARDAFRGGQTDFQIQAFPFRMTAENMARYKGDPNYDFWKMLKVGYDHFEITKVPPKVDVCGKRYVFNAVPEGEGKFSPTSACPAIVQPEPLMTAYQSYQSKYDVAFNAALGGMKPASKKGTIKGVKEAKLVAEWSRKRARGERVSREPPSLDAPETAIASAAPAPRPQPVVEAVAVAETAEPAVVAPEATSQQEAAQAASLPAAAPVPAQAPQAEAARTAAAEAPPVDARAGEDKPVVQVAAEPPAKATVEPRAFAPVSTIKRKLLGMFGS